MPSPFRQADCAVCGRRWETRSLTARTCSPRCRAILRERETPSAGRPTREYPAEIVRLACGLYTSGLTVAEIRSQFPRGYRIQTILERYLPARRPTAKRDQRGPANHMWKGDDVGYQAAHLRLGRAADHRCVDCAAVADDWSYMHDCPDEIAGPPSPYCVHREHYAPRCRKCHRRYDRKGVMSNV